MQPKISALIRAVECANEILAKWELEKLEVKSGEIFCCGKCIDFWEVRRIGDTVCWMSPDLALAITAFMKQYDFILDDCDIHHIVMIKQFPYHKKIIFILKINQTQAQLTIKKCKEIVFKECGTYDQIIKKFRTLYGIMLV